MHIPLGIYYQPSEFDFGGRVRTIIDEYNAEEVAHRFYQFLIEQMIPPYGNKHVLKLIGGDFEYQDGHKSFGELDLLISTFNRMNFGIKIQYSTPSEYFRAINNLNLEWTKNYADFLPYTD